MQKYKILNEYFEKDTKTGQFIRYAEVNRQEGGQSTVLVLKVDSDVPFNSLKNGYHEKEA